MVHDGVEHQDTTAAVITPYRNGPLIVRGRFSIVDEDGREIDPGRRTIALCRCGRSGRKPFCDGSHRATGFRAAGGDERPRQGPAPELPRAGGCDPEAGPGVPDPAEGDALRHR